ncbi:hypothetical protein INR49_027666, partial [Caranx melampygus]
MSVQTTQKTTKTYRTVNVSSPETVTSRVISPVSPMPVVQNGSYETVRYLMPVQQAVQQQSYVLMQQPMVQPMMQCVSPVYLQSLPRLSVSSQDDVLYQQRSTVESISGKSNDRHVTMVAKALQHWDTPTS